ncbi:Hypothetical protein FKW44_016433 [Caligus rogercresseyi]|uniref:Uncharacterized protein n=1 Tax=Caligus rogercresseyi TaxID=217165 RepID=A0A7T8H1W0_CALRO|nr:Hypothetical protein FKW44_016433 [Caligus rogercresseyi]
MTGPHKAGVGNYVWTLDNFFSDNDIAGHSCCHRGLVAQLKRKHHKCTHYIA